MNKQEFIRQLEEGLSGVSPEERVAALQYYKEFIDEAGPEREEEVLAELGSPQKVAADVRAASGEEEGWTPPAVLENESAAPQQEPQGQQESAAPAPQSFPAQADAPPNAAGQSPQDGLFPPPFTHSYDGGYSPPNKEQGGEVPPSQNYSGYAQNPPVNDRNSVLKILLIVLLVLFSPAIFGVLVTAVVLLFVPFISGTAMVAAGIACAILGIFTFGASVASGLVTLGIALFVLGLGLLCFYGGVWILRRGIPACVRGVKSLYSAVFR